MRIVLLSLVLALSASADWSTRETAQLRVTPFPVPARLPAALQKFGVANDTRPHGMQIIVEPRPGVVLPVGDEYRVTVRYRGLDGKTYSITRNLTPDTKGIASAFVKCDIDEPLTVTAEPVKRSPAEEAQ